MPQKSIIFKWLRWTIQLFLSLSLFVLRFSRKSPRALWEVNSVGNFYCATTLLFSFISEAQWKTRLLLRTHFSSSVVAICCSEWKHIKSEFIKNWTHLVQQHEPLQFFSPVGENEKESSVASRVKERAFHDFAVFRSVHFNCWLFKDPVHTVLYKIIN